MNLSEFTEYVEDHMPLIVEEMVQREFIQSAKNPESITTTDNLSVSIQRLAHVLAFFHLFIIFDNGWIPGASS